MRIEVRAGVQLGKLVYAFVKTAPSLAIASRLGVLTTEFPIQPRQSPLYWSAIRNKMLGFLAVFEMS